MPTEGKPTIDSNLCSLEPWSVIAFLIIVFSIQDLENIPCEGLIQGRETNNKSEQ